MINFDEEIKRFKPSLDVEEVEDAIVNAACMIRATVITGDYIADALEQELDELQREIKAAQKELKKANRR